VTRPSVGPASVAARGEAGDRSRQPATASARTPAADPLRWVERLRSSGAERDAAVAELHALLLRAARFEVRRRAALAKLRGGDEEDLAHQSADDALVAVLSKLDDFRGDSRFTTWAYKFGLYEAAVRVRRLSWQEREVTLDPDSWPLLVAGGGSPHEDAEMRELLLALREAIESDLSPHQREVVMALALNEVPIDVLAERLNTTRGALYKTLHDGRRKLRAAIAARGHALAGEPS
jgi:RNA polymerase sigma-70 factor (ECF subfamily)